MISKYSMRKWINLVENTEEDIVRAKELLRQHGGKVMPFNQLPDSAKKAVHHYMVIDGDRPDYATDLLYMYGTIPTDLFLRALHQALVVNNLDDEDYGTEDDWVASYQDKNEVYRNLEGYDFSKHDLVNPWPVMLGSEEFMQDGWHRSSIYAASGLTEIPCIYFIEKSDPDHA